MVTSKEIDECKEVFAENLEVSVLPSTTFQIPKVAWWKNSGLRKLCAMIPILFSARRSMDMMGSFHRRSVDFDNPTGSTLSVLTAIHNTRGICALIVASYIADLLGRRAGVAVGIILIIVGVIVQSAPSVDRGMFIAGGFLVGLGSNISQGSALLVTELAHPQHQGTLTTMYNTLWYVGSSVATWTVFGTIKYTSDASWRIPAALQAAMPAIQFVGIWLLPESPAGFVRRANTKRQSRP
ncbi:hypothetical protein BDV12DRAFT_191946 [Aspergillus spectabilis]